MASLIITEKPSSALKIAQALSPKFEKKAISKISYYELEYHGKKILIGCAVGHLYNLREKNKKGWTYPVYETEWVPSYTLSKHSAFTKKYVEALEKLASQSTEFYVATDFDLEGSLIGYNIIRFICNKQDGKRMKFSTLTKEELQDSFEHASQHLDFNLIESGEARHIVDWIYGINLSRALTLAIKHASNRFKIMSSGRVQGPALKILAERELAIQKFTPEPFWEIPAFGELNSVHESQPFFNEQESKKIHEKIKQERSATVKQVSKHEFMQEPPHPFDLTSLQLEAYRCLKIQPKTTLELAQALYTNAYISYPRTSSHQLPEALNLRRIIQDLGKQEKYAELCKELLKSKLTPNNGKKTDPAHPAISPTGIAPEGLTKQEADIYDLIVRRTLATFAKPAKRETLTINLDIKDEPFIAQGTRTTEKAWHVYYGRFAKFKEQELPGVKEHQKIRIDKIELLAKETQPPKRYTQASIIKEMEKKSLGTKATRAAIIDSLYQRNYIWENSIQVTSLGMKTIETLDKYCPEILDVKMTRHLEKNMEAIREGKQKKEKVIGHAKKDLDKILTHFKENELKIGKELTISYEATQKQETLIGKCNLCDGDLRIIYSRKNKSYFIACSKYPECKNTFSLPRYALPKPANETCPECSSPLVLMIRKGKRPYKFCIGRDCPAKKRWFEQMQKKDKEEAEENKQAGENKKHVRQE
ncbi:MAG TPA: DNA topoisomerase I [Candidatus Nanoarchaeia archaeon]|nr:DNA topoisomerase I [Candidatus Nanoarchaeia archaeon]